jgi:hypothetical protein
MIESITANTLTVNRLAFKLTSATIYEKSQHQSNLSSFAVGDRVKVTFITDRSVLRLEGDTSSGDSPTRTPTHVATPHLSRLTARLAPLGVSKARGECVGSYSETGRRFTLNIQIPRNTIPFATTNGEAETLSVNAKITRHGKLVATCATSFALNQRKRAVFEFKTDLTGKGHARSRNIASRKGRCVLPNGSVGPPIVRLGDLVTVSETTAGEFLTGDF